MAWLLLLLIPGAAALFIWLSRKRASARRRIADWENLHERGKLFAEQLLHIQTYGTHPPPPAPVDHPARGSHWPQDGAPRVATPHVAIDLPALTQQP